MVKIIDTSTVDPDSLSEYEKQSVYNGFDCCITREVFDVIHPQLDNHTAATYNFSKSLQGPALEMRLRGVLVDQRRKNEVIEEFYEKIDLLERNLERIVLDGLGKHSFNWRSNPDLHDVFYKRLGLAPIIRGGKPTVNRDALEALEAYQIARPIVRHIQAMRDLGKKIGVLRTEIDPDGRIRTSYNIAGTNSGRFSSSFSDFGTGTNLQNTEESLRSIFVADMGYKFAKCDGAQIQSRIVGAIEWELFKDGRYLDACESDDLHTVVAKMCWPNLPWTGNMKKDKDLAETPFYRHYSHRFMCKKIGHGSNFKGQPPTISAQTKLPQNVIEQFQPKYFKAFPGHYRWFEWTDDQIRRHGYIVSLDGRKRWCHGRRGDDSVIRDMLAYQAQSPEAYIVNNGMMRIWLDRTAVIMMHDHDALTFMYPEEREDEVIPQIMERLRFPVQLQHNRELIIPFDCKVGWNKGEYCCGDRTNPKCKDCKKTVNLDGLRDYKPGDGKRKREPEMSILDRPIRRIS